MNNINQSKWYRAWEKVLKRLTSSGFHPDLRDSIQRGLQVGLPKIQEAYRVYWSIYDNTDAIAAISPLLIENERVDLNIVWHMIHMPRVKKMNFGSDNEKKLKEIAESVAKQEPCSVSGMTKYDVTFSYKPPCWAFYSEEYRGKAHGHYYIALDTTHALFWEDD